MKHRHTPISEPEPRILVVSNSNVAMPWLRQLFIQAHAEVIEVRSYQDVQTIAHTAFPFHGLVAARKLNGTHSLSDPDTLQTTLRLLAENDSRKDVPVLVVTASDKTLAWLASHPDEARQVANLPKLGRVIKDDQATLTAAVPEFMKIVRRMQAQMGF
jgi:hypothetical protein